METFNPAPAVCQPNAKDSILWLVLVALAALLRVGPIASGLPYSDYVDEGHILHPAIKILKSKSFDPSFPLTHRSRVILPLPLPKVTLLSTDSFIICKL
jgi:hypothetical protein